VKYRSPHNTGGDASQVWNLEALEARRLMTVTLVDGILTVTGTQSSDALAVNMVWKSEYDHTWQLMVSKEGMGIAYFDSAQVRGIVLEGGDGNDHLEVGNSWAPVSIPATIYGGAGDDSLFGGTGDDHLYGGAGADRVGGDDVSSYSGIDVPAGATVVGHDTILPGQGNDVVDGEADPSGFRGDGRRLGWMSISAPGVLTVDTSGGGGDDLVRVYLEQDGGPTYLVVEYWHGDGSQRRLSQDSGTFLATITDVNIYHNGGAVTLDVDPAVYAAGVKVTFMDPAPVPQPEPVAVSPAKTEQPAATAPMAAAPPPVVTPGLFATNELLVSDSKLWDL
jgi:hypothetical protein